MSDAYVLKPWLPFGCRPSVQIKSSCEADRLFHALDSNKSGRISFDDFVVGLAVCCRGTLEEKMRFLFGVYDMNEVYLYVHVLVFGTRPRYAGKWCAHGVFFPLSVVVFFPSLCVVECFEFVA